MSNSVKPSHAHGATKDGQVMVGRSDRLWSTGEGNGKPLQYYCLENSMNNGMRFVTLYRRQGSRPSPWKRNAKKAKWLTGEALQIAVKRREVKSRRKGKI